MIKHLLIESGIRMRWDHAKIRSIFSYMALWEWRARLANSLKSSANATDGMCIFDRSESMKIDQSVGPKQLPWITPEVTTAWVDKPSHWTLWVRPVKKLCIHPRALPETPLLDNTAKSLLCWNRSNAREKSKKITSIDSWQFAAYARYLSVINKFLIVDRYS